MKYWRTAAAAACAALLGPSAFSAFYWDADIKILRADGSPTVTVQYNGAKASRVEVRVNGTSIGYRSVQASKDSGEVAFRIGLDSLQSGENLIEALLLDADGKVIGEQRTTMLAQKGENLPVYIRLPKMGDTVQGTVEIKVGFGIEMRETYVSFFVDKEFRSMKNFPPFNYHWDTTKETNGWHEIEAWSFDVTQTTRKSPPLRVFVNNPGGRTERETTGNVTGSNVDPKVNGAAGMKVGGAKPASGEPGISQPGNPAVTTGIAATPPIGKRTGVKVGDNVGVELSGHRLSSPRSLSKPVETNAGAVAKPVSSKVSNPVPAVATVSIKYGTRLANEGPYSLFINGTEVRFDVAPSVENGIPFTPFRHLYEQAGGSVDWSHIEKICTATGLGAEIWLKIGDLFAKVDGTPLQLESAPFLRNSRTIVPLSFITDALKVDVQYDAKTGHVLITNKESGAKG